MKTLIRLLAALAVIVAAQNAAAAELPAGFPNRPVRLVTGAAGSPPDLVARVFADALSVSLGKPVVVENRPAAFGTIGVDLVAKSAPDGHTLALIGLPTMVGPSVLPELPYRIERDLAPVAQTSWSANVVVVRPGSPIRSLAELVAAARAKPKGLTYASAGNGTPSHLATELFRELTGVDVEHVPFKGIPAGLVALMGEQVDFSFAGVAAALPLVTGGKLRALAVTSPQRLPPLPDVPTIAELGYPGYSFVEWHGIVVTAGTPADVIAALERELHRAGHRPEVAARLAAAGVYPVEDVGAHGLAALIATELPRWRGIVRRAGIRAD